jgi:guanylate kinase
MPRACPIVLAAPSGTGKTTLARSLVEGSDRFGFSVSVTTRSPRYGERDGIDYHFVDREHFEAMVAARDLVEWAEVHGRWYGTPKAGLDAAADRGEHVVLDIDVQGARQIREAVPDVKLIFVLPPSVEALLSRLAGRGTEDPSEVARRLSTALRELQTVDEFDYVVVNDEIDRCLSEIRAIADSEARGAKTDAHLEEVEALRSEIERVLDQEYADYSNIN